MEIISSHYSNDSFNKEIVRTHDYYLAKDIRKKKNKQREPKFIYDENKNKILAYKINVINYQKTRNLTSGSYGVIDLFVDQYCSNKPTPDQHRFLVDWIEYEILD